MKKMTKVIVMLLVALMLIPAVSFAGGRGDRHRRGGYNRDRNRDRVIVINNRGRRGGHYRGSRGVDFSDELKVVGEIYLADKVLDIIFPQEQQVVYVNSPQQQTAPVASGHTSYNGLWYPDERCTYYSDGDVAQCE